MSEQPSQRLPRSGEANEEALVQQAIGLDVGVCKVYEPHTDHSIATRRAIIHLADRQAMMQHMWSTTGRHQMFLLQCRRLTISSDAE